MALRHGFILTPKHKGNSFSKSGPKRRAVTHMGRISMIWHDTLYIFESSSECDPPVYLWLFTSLYFCHFKIFKLYKKQKQKLRKKKKVKQNLVPIHICFRNKRYKLSIVTCCSTIPTCTMILIFSGYYCEIWILLNDTFTF